MARSFTLVEKLSLEDLHVYLGRAMRVQDGSARLIAAGGVLAVYVPVLFPVGLLDETPTVLGLRTFALASQEQFDSVVPMRSLAARVEGRMLAAESSSPVEVGLPMEVNTVTWAAISPPRGGWRQLEAVDAALLDAAARGGIESVAAAVPEGAGEQIVQRVRAEVWGAEVAGLPHVPAGAAFAGLSLGFLPEGEPVDVYESGPWTRLTTSRGHVLIKRRGWTLAR